MTTLVYHKDTHAFYADGRECTNSGVILDDNAQKIYEMPNGDVLAGAGDCHVIEQVVEMWDVDFSAEDFHDLPAGSGCTFLVWYSDTDKVTMLSIFNSGSGPEVCESTISYNIAVGSGDQFALAAMDLGLTAPAAIEYAATRDTGTGPIVRMRYLNSELPCVGVVGGEHEQQG